MQVKEETIDSSSIPEQSFQIPLPPSSLLNESIILSANILASPPAPATSHRRASVRQQKRRSLREPNSSKDLSGSAKKKTKFDNGNILNTDIGADSIDQISTRSNSTEQQSVENIISKIYKIDISYI